MNNGRYITAMWEHWAVSNLVTAASINWRIEGWNPGALSVIVSGYFFEHNSGFQTGDRGPGPSDLGMDYPSCSLSYPA